MCPDIALFPVFVSSGCSLTLLWQQSVHYVLPVCVDDVIFSRSRSHTDSVKCELSIYSQWLIRGQHGFSTKGKVHIIMCFAIFSIIPFLGELPSVLWRCWLGCRKGIQPVKNRVVGCWCGCLSGVADLHMAQLMPLPLTVSCFSEIQIDFTFLVPAHLGSPRKRAVKVTGVCVFQANSFVKDIPAAAKVALLPAVSVGFVYVYINVENSSICQNAVEVGPQPLSLLIPSLAPPSCPSPISNPFLPVPSPQPNNG